jgi:uncharacterized damage-inducible protein DinB
MKASTPLLLLAAMTALAAPLDKHDRDRVLSELQASRKMFLDSIAGLSPAQWTYKPAPDRWSIQEVAEHITTAEGFIFSGFTQKLMQTPADPAKAEQRKAGNEKMDEEIVRQVNNRGKKVQAPEPLVPKGRFATPADAAEAFKAAREKTIEYVRTTQDALREHLAKMPSGEEMDAVQSLLYLAGHTERHVAQIEEVKQSAGYPRGTS